MVRAGVAVGVTGSLVAALALSYAVFPGSVVPQPARQALERVAAGDDSSTETVLPAGELGDPLRQPTGAIAGVVVRGEARRALARAETAARQDLHSPQPDPPKGPPLDAVTAAFLTAGISLVRSSVTEKGTEGSERTRATVAGRTVDVAVGSTTEDGRIRTVALVESTGTRTQPTLRSVETLDGLPCPDQDGSVEFEVRVEVDAAPARGKDPLSTVAAAAVSAEVDARAELRGAEARLSTSPGGDSPNVSGSVEMDASGALGEVVAQDPPAAGPERRRVEEGLVAARALAVGALAAAQERWRTGDCLGVTASLPDEVEEGSATAFAPEVTSLLDAEQVEAELSVDVQGPGTVRKDGDGFVFVAGSERGRTTTLRVRAVSVRGVAETTLEVATPSPDLRVDADYKSVRMRGVKCAGPEGRWEVDLVSDSGSAVGELSFRLDERLRGAYAGSRQFASPAGTITVGEGGAALYLADRQVLVLSDREGGEIQVPVELGAYC